MVPLRTQFMKFHLAISACLMIATGCQLVSAKPRRQPHAPRLTRSQAKQENLINRYGLNKRVSKVEGPEMRRNLQALSSRGDVKRFLGVIKKAEGGKPNIMVGGCLARSLNQHPALTLPRKCRYPIRLNGRRTFSTASGNYQLTFSNWKKIAPFLGLRNFSENNQALAALELIRRGGGAAESRTQKGLSLKRRIQAGFINLLKGNLKSALCLATYDWASSKCSPFPAGYKVDYTRLLNSAPRSRRVKQ